MAWERGCGANNKPHPPHWHGVGGHEEAPCEARNGGEDGGDAVGVAGLGHGDEGQQGYPGVVESEVEDGELCQHPHAVATVGHHLGTQWIEREGGGGTSIN